MNERRHTDLDNHLPQVPEHWRSIEELEQAPEFRTWQDHEFPLLAAGMGDHDDRLGANRRQFLRFMAASLSLAGVTGWSGCRRPAEKILPYNRKPEDVIPGQPLYYATTMVMAGMPLGLLIETHEGRPTKVEGNPAHPLSLGATHAWAQASVLDLYDPDRSRFVIHEDQPSTWDDFLVFLDRQVQLLRSTGGQGLAILSEEDGSPATGMLRDRLVEALPQATWHLDVCTAAARRQPRLQLERADVIVSLDCDLLNTEDAGVAYRKAFAKRRSLDQPEDPMNRLYVIEPCPTVTGMSADHRLRLPLSQMYNYVLRLAKALDVEGLPEPATSTPTWDSRWIDTVADDLQSHRGRSIVVAGRRLPEHVQEVVRRINQQLGNIGKTVSPSRASAEASSYQRLLERLQAGEVTMLVLLGVNLLASAPSDIDLRSLIQKVPTRIHLGLYRDETAELCQWHVPQAHYLESWGDAQTGDTLSPVQPVIEPLMGGKTPLELLARLAGYATTDPYALVRESFAAVTGNADVERRFREYLHTGVAAAPTASEQEPTPVPESLPPVETLATDSQRFEIAWALDPSVYDGRWANNGWLQECPDPLTKLTWDNAALLSPATAQALDVETGDVVKIEVHDRSIEIPTFVLPGCVDAVVTLPLGYGRSKGGVLAAHAGVDVSPLRTTAGMDWVVGAKVTRTGRHVRLATTQQHWSIRDHEKVFGQLQKRGIIREVTREQFQEHPEIVRHMDIHAPTEASIYEVPSFEGRQQWALSIDLTKCVGCNACVTACQSENNIPLVGRDEVIRGRELHWIRIDRYFAGHDPRGDVTISSQPMLCQHCEIAPCEQVCPVNATVHDEEGLNVMTYNRCIGTRYCSNNCPYKVRRFNFYDYNKGTLRTSDAPFDRDPEPNPLAGLSQPQLLQPEMDELIKMQKNPDVTVRMRGVMEKCTFCVQRIQQAKIAMKVRAGQTTQSIEVPDGTIQPACQQVCPTEAIVFGDMSDSSSRVAKLQQDRRAYRVIEHVGTRPRVSYLARVRNVHPEMPAALVAPTPIPHGDEGSHAPNEHEEPRREGQGSE